jgi:hypothetical protein
MRESFVFASSQWLLLHGVLPSANIDERAADRFQRKETVLRYDFDTPVDRRGTDCLKWDYLEAFYGREDIEPFWVADMDFKAPPEIIEPLLQRAEHGVFGYTAKPEGFYRSVIDWFREPLQLAAGEGLDSRHPRCCARPQHSDTDPDNPRRRNNHSAAGLLSLQGNGGTKRQEASQQSPDSG